MKLYFFFYSTRIKYKYLPSNGINRKYRMEKVSIHIKSRSLFSITHHRWHSHSIKTEDKFAECPSSLDIGKLWDKALVPTQFWCTYALVKATYIPQFRRVRRRVRIPLPSFGGPSCLVTVTHHGTLSSNLFKHARSTNAVTHFPFAE